MLFNNEKQLLVAAQPCKLDGCIKCNRPRPAPTEPQQLTDLPHFVTDILLDNQQASETCW